MNSNVILIVWSSRYFRRMIIKSVYRNIFREPFLKFLCGDFLYKKNLRFAVKSSTIRILYINSVENTLYSLYFVSRIFSLNNDIIKFIYNNIVPIDYNSYTFYRHSL